MADWDTNNPDDNDIVSQYPSNERAARGAVVTNFGVDHHSADDSDVGKHEAIQLVDQAGDATIDAGDIGIWNDGGNLKTRTGAGSVELIAKASDVSGLVFPSGTKMVFYQASAPAGWTQDTGVNDQVLKVVSGAGGGAGGSWTISGATVSGHALTISEMPSHDHGNTGSAGSHNHSMQSAGSHGHTGSTNTTGSHNHSVSARATDGGGTQFVAGSSGLSNALTTGSAGSHSHSLSINSNGSHAHTINSGGAHTHDIPHQGGGSAHAHGITHDGSWRPAHINVIVATKD